MRRNVPISERRTESVAAVLIVACALSGGAPSHAQDAESGEQVFRSNCSICHSLQPGRVVVGPSLFGVVGRHAGSAQGFHYSAANLASGLTWDPKTLDRYLTNPREMVPGTLMTFPGLKDPAKRADVIAFLARLH